MGMNRHTLPRAPRLDLPPLDALAVDADPMRELSASPTHTAAMFLAEVVKRCVSLACN